MTYKALWKYLSKRRQKQFWFLTALMIISSFSEVISLGAVLPFLGALTAPETLYHNELMQPIIKILEISNPDQLLLPLTTLFIIAVLLAAFIRLVLLYVMTRLSFATGADLSIDIYKRTLFQEYEVHLSRNSSEVIDGIITKTNTVIGGIISPVLNLISSVILLISIMGALIVINFNIALSSFIGFGLIYSIVIYNTKAQLSDNSLIIARHSTQMIKSLQEGLGGIRDVLIDSSQQFFVDLYRKADLPLRKASGNNVFIGASPRYAVEAIGMSLVAVIAYAMTNQNDSVVSVIPILGALALGAQRLLPALQQAYGSYSTIKSSRSSFKDVLNLLNQPFPEDVNQQILKPISFEKKIEIKKLNFRYSDDTPWILKDFNLTIKKGETIGFIGSTGSGKSTLIDVVMGLLKPTSGELIIDQQSVSIKNRRAWQIHIAHVPQSIFLSDGTIEENIAFGIPRNMIDHQQVTKAAEDAQISELIGELKNGYKTLVGERGMRLSGEQRQRIGIARALYKKADVLILDEATSALDNKTEQEVIKAINGFSKELTIFIIAHRLTTLKNCNRIVKLEQNCKMNIHNYKEISGEK